MKTLYLVFNDFEFVHLGKDVFLVPFYICRFYHFEGHIVFPATATNAELPDSFRGVELHRISCNESSARYKDKILITYVKQHAKQIDVLMMFHWEYYTIYSCLLYKRINKKGKVYVKLDCSQHYFPRRVRVTGFTTLRNALLWRKFWRSIDLFSCETFECYKMLLESTLKTTTHCRLAYIPNGFDESMLKDYNISINNFEQKQNVIIAVGRLGSQQKNTEMLLDALDGFDLHGWKVRLIGPFTQSIEMQVTKLKQRNPASASFIELVGNISDKKTLFEEYNRAKVFVLTSDWEGFALVFVEALRFGNYIISTDVGAAKDVTNNGAIGSLIDPGNVYNLRKQLEQVVLGNINLRTKYAESISLALNQFLWENIIQNSNSLKALFKKDF